MVVVAIVAIASVGVLLAVPEPGQAALEKEGVRLASLLDTARVYSRSSGVAVTWRPTEKGFRFDGLTPAAATLFERESHWLTDGVQSPTASLVLGPEPIIPAQTVMLQLGQSTLVLETDGLQPFTVQTLPLPGTDASMTR